MRDIRAALGITAGSRQLGVGGGAKGFWRVVEELTLAHLTGGQFDNLIVNDQSRFVLTSRDVQRLWLAFPALAGLSCRGATSTFALKDDGSPLRWACRHRRGRRF